MANPSHGTISKARSMLREFGDVMTFFAVMVVMTLAFNKLNGFPLKSLPLLLGTFGLWAFILGPTIWLGRRARAMTFLGISSLASIVFWSNQLHFRHFYDFITVSSLRFAGQLVGVRDSILPLAKPEDLLYLIPLALVGVICWQVFRVPDSSRRASPLAAFGVGGVGLGLCCAVYVPMMAQWDQEVAWTGNQSYVSQAGLFTFHGYDFGRYVAKKVAKPVIEPASLERVRVFFEHRELPLAPHTGIARGKNLIVVQLESFESFPVGLSLGGQEVTPNLNRLAQSALFFPNIYFQTAKGNTSDAEFMVNNSLFPLREASVNFEFVDNDFQALPLMLKQDGYSSLAFHGYNKTFWNRGRMYPRWGFERFYGDVDFRYDDEVNIGLSDESFYRQAFDILKNQPEPFYAKLISLTSHHPFRIPEELRELALDASLPEPLQDYLHAAHYADKALGQLLRALEATGLMERSVLVIYGDHEGISSSYPKEVLALQGRPADRGEEYSKATLQTVPLFIRVPDSTLRGTHERIGGQIDILPTLANLMGIAERGVFMGDDLLGGGKILTPMSGRWALGSFVDEEEIYVASVDGRLENGILFDRLTGVARDPREASDKYQKVLELYDLSRSVIQHNLVPQLLESARATRPPKALIHGG